jgi:hypothetical protein
MGVNVVFIYLVLATDKGFKTLLLCLVIVEVIFPSGARPALLMGVVPEAMVEYL